ncbi:MAG: ATP-binding protein [Nocardiopsaceae bacterium]|nr:ATP-binding protein [Nocardiopsaceae bacterium]
MTDNSPPHGPESDKTAEADDGAMRTELPADLSSARQARVAVRQALADWRMEHLSGDAELLASELVANAAEHGDGNPISLALHRHAEPGGRPGITCEVSDSSPDVPRPRQAGPDEERGRGLAIVHALANSSGVRPEPAGKTSWFTLAVTDRARQNARQIDREPEAGG